MLVYSYCQPYHAGWIGQHFVDHKDTILATIQLIQTATRQMQVGAVDIGSD